MYLTEIRKPLLAASLSVILSLAAAAPELAFPLNSQVPPVAYVSQPYNFAFSADTFTSNAPEITYTIAHGPKWLDLDSASRQFRGIPNQSDIGTTIFQLVASDLTGQSSTNVTFIVLESSTLTLNAPVLPQLEQSGLVSPPNSLLAHPQQSFHLVFEKQIFDGATLETRYYAVSADNTPLPPWVQFDESRLEISGTTPALVSPLAESQTYSLRLIASNVPGFAESAVDFQIVISRRILAFSPASQDIQISSGDHFQTLPLRPLITLDGGPVTDDQIVSIDATVPAWVKLDRKQLSLSGTAVDTANTTITITVMDIYHDIANATIFLENTGASNVSLGIIGVVNVTAGECFSYNSINPTSSPWVRAVAALGSAAAWLGFNNQTWVLSGSVPPDLSPQTLNISITFANSSTVATGEVILQVLRKPIATAMTPTHTTELPTSSKASGTSKASERAMSSPNGNTSNSHVLHIVLACVFSVVGALLAVCLTLCCLRRRRKGKETNNASFEEGSALADGRAYEPPNQSAQAAETAGRPPYAQDIVPSDSLRMTPAWSHDSLKSSRKRLSGTGRPHPLSQHRTSQILTPGSLFAAQLEAAQGFDRARDTAYEPLPLPANPRLSLPGLPAFPSRLSEAGLQSQLEDSTTNTHASPVSHVVGLPDRRSGAGHGAGILITPDSGLDQSSWRNTWASNPSSDRRRTTLVLDSFPAPPVTGATTARAGSQTKKSGPCLRVVPEDSSQPLSFEEQRQKWHTERARARLEGSARFSNAGSARMMASPQTKWPRNTAALADRGPPTSPPTAGASREHPWSRWSGLELGAREPARMGSLVPSYPGNTPMLRTQVSIAGSGQFDSVTSSDSYLEDENSAIEETRAEGKQWPASNSSQSLPRLPFNPVPPSRDNMRNGEFSTDAKQQAWSVNGRRRISVEEGGLKRSQASRRGSFRFI
ncbi:uncharacterized protein Z520_06307 [Fonsecaea multimorphosa CBS 102226]|uniref:Dystroglycan-type cadherin-like domain-containing protein n=1 Tax=Fonsecaea multimorphosa CBS 102226 TaxID=1442371 RepID=A0A0D2JXE1_9EURO|nr:uncharacterized protein Z520_06307 [Fonsecaea multimorphosa CBS 102226]KIX98227.1 hypothetical protein Z520_06307 [Fonsecaea multimorphosa CBS 102226]